MANAPSLSRGQVHRALRSFVVASGLWGAWGQACGLGTAAFTGFALYLGADGAFIALFTSAAYFLALTQLLAPLLSARVRDKKRFVVFGGYVEIAFRGLPLIIPLFVPEQYRLPALVAMVCLSMFSGYAISPFYSTWIANAVPENIRARFASRQTIVSTIVAMIAGFAIGQFLDFFPGGGFVWVFAAGSLFGFLGYLNLLRAPFPQQTTASDEQSTRLRDLVLPFYDANFRRAALFFGLWTFGIGLAGPLYSVFMLDRLQISYTEVSIFNALFMLTSIAGYRLWAGLIDRFGARPVLQILMTPAAFLPLIWTFNQPGAYHLVPVALVISGILFSGIGVGINPLLYGLLPQGEKRTMYLATWSVTVNLMGALGPLFGGLLVAQLEGLRFSVFGVPMGDLQVIFALSALVRLVPLFILRTVKDARSATSRSLLSRMLRGNVLSYAYNATIFSLATAEGTRARAAEALGRSGNPLAIEQLVQALADASPRVRRAAARALGESRSESATEPLVRELLDGASDIRSEAAEALGRLGSSTSIDPLVEALDDADPRVRISAIRGLASLRGDEVHELLFWHFGSDFDPLTFPTLVDVLGDRQDRRIVRPALGHLPDFPSPAVRLQLLNGVCRALGAGDQFYRLLSREDTDRVAAITRLLRRATDTLGKARCIDTEDRAQLKTLCREVVVAYEEEKADALVEAMRQVVRTVRDGLSATSDQAYDVLSVYVVLIAIGRFINSPVRQESPVAQEIFLTVCLGRLAALIREIDDSI
ncbi:MAG: MFS transporter [Gemmatimonadetes bacterium]|nr:MFS transporter [Gemmatimonadota bacterium]